MRAAGPIEMTVLTTVLFGKPQQEIASLIRGRLSNCASAQIVSGFATVEGIESIADPLRASPGKLEALVVGAATYRAFDALDQLVRLGAPLDRLHVHLGHSRQTTSSAKYRFYRYHPMLHSKVYYFDMANGQACAFIGSHNITGFALLGLNGEASVLLEGEVGAPQFAEIRAHIQESIAQATPYDPTMKEAYAWWTHEFMEGLAQKANDLPRDGEAQRTIIVLAEGRTGEGPKEGDKIYFELPAALGKVQTMSAEVHIYVFDHLPPSPAEALLRLDRASATVWCKIIGLEDDQGGAELDADWFIANRRHPELRPTSKPFRPKASADMQQVRVEAYKEIYGDFEYLFE